MNKPSYRIPSMEEIAAIPWNGYNVISTFAGCGGSSLGYKLAGFKVLWANEFIPIAAETYRLNHPGTIVDERDIRQIQPEEVLEAIDLKQGELDILDGSPPCDSFSTAGKREKSWNKVKDYLGTKQRTDDLFWEYARLVKEIQPKVFIAENVSGLVKGTAKGYFKEILQILKDCGYKVKAKLLDAQWLKVPQSRKRIIFIGVRNDLKKIPLFPKPLNYWYTTKEAFEGLENTSDTPKFNDKYARLYDLIPWGHNASHVIGKGWNSCVKIHPNKPAMTIPRTTTGHGFATIVHYEEKRSLTIEECKRLCSFPDDFELIGTFQQQWERLGNSVPPMMMYYIAKTVKEEILDGIKIPYSEVMANV